MSDPKELQAALEQLYETWKSGSKMSGPDAVQMSPPLLLNVFSNTAWFSADIRVMVFGQETLGWRWASDQKDRFPAYPENFAFTELDSFEDFLRNEDAVRGLCWAYNAFGFSKHQPQNFNSPFWRAFREINEWPESAALWSNLARSNYSAGDSSSIMAAPEELRRTFLAAQVPLVTRELTLLEPTACVFLTGPNYDDAIKTVFPETTFSACSKLPVREMARVEAASLPANSFRTYHPNYLSRSEQWGHLELLRELVAS